MISLVCHHRSNIIGLALWLGFFGPTLAIADEPPRKFFETHCLECHDVTTKEAGLDLSSLKLELNNAENFARWVKIHDRLAAGEMPPKKKARPPADDTAAVVSRLRESLTKVDREKRATERQTTVRRMTRAEYENTLRDLFEMPGLAVQGDLPADGMAYGFDKHAEALDISHVHLAKYLEAADKALDLAIATRPRPPKPIRQRISLANPAGFVAHVLLHGDGVLLKDKKPDPDFPPAGAQMHLDQGAHERIGSFHSGSTVGLFRHEDESFHPSFIEFTTLYPGRYRLRTSLWSFQWDKGQVLPARGTEVARLSVIQLSGDGRGGDHPNYVLGYYDAPSLHEQVHEIVTWLNYKETIGFNAASLATGGQTRGKDRAMGFTGPGIACDYLEVEGPLHDVWPPASHRRLFGDLPLVEFKTEEQKGIRPPKRVEVRHEVGAAKNPPDPVPGIWTVKSEKPLADADGLLATFLPRAFRRPVSGEVRQQYVALVDNRLKAGDSFEAAMRWAYRAALCSPDFLYHVEPVGQLDDYAIAARLSYFFWSSLPDERLTELATAGKLRESGVLHEEVERLLRDPKSQRFIDDFLGQWLKLRQIAVNDPDKKLYPEFSPYLQDSMLGESRAYFRELLEKNFDAGHLIRSDFAMLNEKLAVFYGIPGVSGSQYRRVSLPPEAHRGGFLAQAAILKVTANGTTTSPVPRGAFVMDRLLGQPPEPPPANVAAIEPDVRGAKTIREQLDKHRSDVACASCHRKIDPPGFALECFDVIGGYRSRYRSIGAGDPAPRGAIDPFIGISFKLGPAVDPSGVLADGREFHDFSEFQRLVASDTDHLLTNFANRLAVYATGHNVTFSDREQIAQVVEKTQKQGSGLRTFLHEFVQSRLFQTR